MSKDERLLFLYAGFVERITVCGFSSHSEVVPEFRTIGANRIQDVKVLKLPPTIIFPSKDINYGRINEDLCKDRDHMRVNPLEANAVVVTAASQTGRDVLGTLAEDIPVSAAFYHVDYSQKLWDLEWGMLDVRDRTLKRKGHFL